MDRPALSFALLLAATTSVALAQIPGREQGVQKIRAAIEERFDRADVDHDGRLTRTESKAMPWVEQNFDAIDTDHGGTVSKRQIRDFVVEQARKHRSE